MRTTDNTATLDEIIARTRSEVRAAADRAATDVRNGTDNPLISRLSRQSFTISSSHLGLSNLSPFSSDWKAQYELLGELIEDQKFSLIAEVIATGKLRDRKNTQVFAHEVVTHLKSIVGDLQGALERHTLAEPSHLKSSPKPRP